MLEESLINSLSILNKIGSLPPQKMEQKLGKYHKKKKLKPKHQLLPQIITLKLWLLAELRRSKSMVLFLWPLMLMVLNFMEASQMDQSQFGKFQPKIEIIMYIKNYNKLTLQI